MSTSPPVVRRGEYAARGDYHRVLNESWDYYPTYIAKLEAVRRWLDRLPAGAAVLDAGCGEGVLVDEYAKRLDIQGLDLNYTSERVRYGSVTDLPYADASFAYALCLDVLEHLTFEDQPKAYRELHRVLRPGGELLISVPNLAHLQSRVHFLLQGRLIRTAAEQKHPGDRPVVEYIALARRSGFELTRQRGIFPTVPILTRWIRRHPRALLPLHRGLTRMLPVAGWCLVNLLTFRKVD
jgi:SAM-dependent methyltransferase